MKSYKIFLVWIYGTMVFLFFGGMLSTIITQYPNYDYDLPNSLVTANDFYTKSNPSTFFQLLGKIITPLFIIMIISIWNLKKTRNLLLAHFILFFLIGLGTGLLVYPILDELFVNNIGDRPINEINELLNRFKKLDFIRSIIAIISCVFLILGITEFHKTYYSKKSKLE